MRICSAETAATISAQKITNTAKAQANEVCSWRYDRLCRHPDNKGIASLHLRNVLDAHDNPQIAAIRAIDDEEACAVAGPRGADRELHFLRQLNFSVDQGRRDRLRLRRRVVAHEQNLEIASAQRLQIARVKRQIA